MAVERLDLSAAAQAESAEWLDALTTGVVVIDAGGRVEHANVAAQSLLAVGLNSARGRRLLDLFVDAAPLQDALHRARDSNETVFDYEVSLRPISAGRDTRPVDLAVTPFESTDGARRYVLELSDAEPRVRRQREQALRARLDGGRLMTRQLAHEVKNPLGGLRGAAQLLARELPDPALREYTQIIISEADRLTTLVDQMLGPARPLRRARLNVHEICEHVYQLLRAEAPDAVALERDYDPSLPDGHFDRDHLVQALLNITRNALQAVGSSGRIVLRTRAVPQVHIGRIRHRLAVRIDVIDDGPGVPEHLRTTLFFPLVTSRPQGTGLGLAVSQELVTRHGGLIEFASEPGRTTFSLLLPLSESEMEGTP
jgi:two-component system nitrogen regulation sensor histidine kinase GlnL